MIRKLHLSLSSKSSEIRSALDVYTPWLQACLCDDLSEVVQLRFPYSLAALAAHKLLGRSCRTDISQRTCEALETKLQRLEFPPGIIPAVSLRHSSLPCTSPQWSAEWLDCPVALYFTGMTGPVIAANIPFVDGMSQGSDWREVALVQQTDIPALLEIVEQSFNAHHSIKIMGGASVNVPALRWDDLVLDHSTSRLVKDDFLLFLKREHWYKEHKLPFRRGYLLHGPPGNGKSSVIRAMLSTPAVSGFTINPFQSFVNEDMLATMFIEAARSVPAVVVLEDLDRWYTHNKEQDCGPAISLQQLLNQLDGVGSQDGIVVVATANDPSVLDPAILLRPGRFDRVVGLPNPSEEMRRQYLFKMHPPLMTDDLTECMRMTTGSSFAQLRETYILAGQIALEEGHQIGAAQLTQAVRTLQEAAMLADPRWKSNVGFRSAESEP